MNIKYTATMPLKSPKNVKILKKEWLTIPAISRRVITYEFTKATDYLRIDMIDNPRIEQLRKLLKKQKVKFKEFTADHVIIFISMDYTL